jgi:hypothetical protein
MSEIRNIDRTRTGHRQDMVSVLHDRFRRLFPPMTANFGHLSNVEFEIGTVIVDDELVIFVMWRGDTLHLSLHFSLSALEFAIFIMWGGEFI